MSSKAKRFQTPPSAATRVKPQTARPTSATRSPATDRGSSGPTPRKARISNTSTCSRTAARTSRCREPGPAEYWTATPDGHYAFYTESGELWRFDTLNNTREGLTAGGAEVQGVIGTNQTGADGGYLYFVADGVLSTNQNAEGEEATAGQPNLYLLRAGNSTPTFIATLSPEDDQMRVSSVAGQEGSDWKANLGERTAEVTPDGRHLVFQSLRKLTGYDNEYSLEHPVVEVFAYSADDEGLACASCNPTGAPPSVNELELRKTKLPVSAESNVYVRRWMSDEGSRIFFDSLQPLSPGDTNGVLDVYEWESEGEGTCNAQNASPSNHGCLFLLSGGSSSAVLVPGRCRRRRRQRLLRA